MNIAVNITLGGPKRRTKIVFYDQHSWDCPTHAMHCVGIRKICYGKEERENSIYGY